jgi:hypothetical protein
MKAKARTVYEICTIGFEGLLCKFGPAGEIRLIQQYESSDGDYMRDRK